jgi:hypothetical protein
VQPEVAAELLRASDQVRVVVDARIWGNHLVLSPTRFPTDLERMCETWSFLVTFVPQLCRDSRVFPTTDAHTRTHAQYLLEGLKRMCENVIAKDITMDNLAPTFELSEAFTAPQLAKR